MSEKTTHYLIVSTTVLAVVITICLTTYNLWKPLPTYISLPVTVSTKLTPVEPEEIETPTPEPEVLPES